MLLGNVVRQSLAPSPEPATNVPIFVLSLLAGIVLVVLGVAALLVGAGLWKLRPWARAIALALSILGLGFFPLATLMSLLRPQPVPVLAQLGAAVFCAVVIWYLNRAQVRRAFGSV
jgi:uncharacterized membrane protein (DUF2068 family)